MRPFTSNAHRATAATAALLVLAPAAWIGGFRNGSFEERFEGWQLETPSARKGAARGAAWATIDTAWAYLGADGTVATLNVDVSAGVPLESTEPGSAACGRARLRQEIADIPSTHLAFDWGAGFIGDAVGRGTVTWRARLVVERIGSGPLRHELELLPASEVSLDEGCGLWIAWDGYERFHAIDVDLAGSGFRAGDDVRVTVELEALALLRTACDFARFAGSLSIDRFRFEPPRTHQARPRAPTPVSIRVP